MRVGDRKLDTHNDKTTVWRLITHHADPPHALLWARKTGRLAIGWGRIGDIKAQGYTSPRDISEAINEAYPDIGNAGSGGVCLHDFYYRMKPGDWVILSTGGRRALVMEVEGGYEYKPTPEEPPIGDYQHQRKANILPIDADALWRCAGSAPIVGRSIRWTLVKCLKPIDAATRATLLPARSTTGARETTAYTAEDYISADEVAANAVYQEGAVRQVTVNAYERNPQARWQCIAHYGTRCFVCGFDFGEIYGEVGSGYIHVHHLRQLADVGTQYEVNPVADLRPVCPNCHAVIHRRTPPYSIEEVQAMLRGQSA